MTNDPKAMRPIFNTLRVVGKFLDSNPEDFYMLSEREFIGYCMKEAGGSIDPTNLSQLYQILMDEAGVT